MKNAIKSVFIAVSCLWASTVLAETVTVNLALAQGTNPTPPVGEIIGDNFNVSKFDGTGYKIPSDGNSIGWNIASTGKVIKSASFNGYINTTSTSKNWGISFSTNGGSSWGSELTQANDGIKSLHDIPVTVAIPAGANAIKIVRRAGTSTYVAGITLELGYLNPVTSISVAPTSLNVVQGDVSQLTATVLPANATHPDVIWSSSDLSIASVDPTGKVTALGIGSATITATTEDGGFTASCPINVAVNPNPVAVTGVTLNKTTTSIWPGNSETLIASILPANATIKGVTWSSNNTSVATVDQTGKVNGLVNGMATITVTTVEGQFTASCKVEVSDVLPMPQTNLSLHEPGIYEEKTSANGYNTKMTEWQNRAYEVFYCFKGKNSSGSSVPSVATTPKGTFLTDDEGNALDGWFKANPGSMEDGKVGAIDEFAADTGNWKMNGQYLELHVQGYDRFAIVAADNDASNTAKQFHVYLNTAEKPQTPSTTPSKRTFELNPNKEYLIRVEAGTGGQMKLYSFSLREGQVPKTKYHKGNDSTQTVLQTTAIKPVTYVTKYNNIPGAETKLVWFGGKEATGISLTTFPGKITDTLKVSGTALCPVGEYKYAIVAYFNGVEVNRAEGKFTVATDIWTMSASTDAKVYTNEVMDEIKFQYYALNANDVRFNWMNQTPAGISGRVTTPGNFVISGTPTSVGTYPYSITVTDADTTIIGTIEVEELNYGNNPVLYLYKNDDAYNKDGVFKYLTSQEGGNRNLIKRKVKENGLRPADQYARYDWILISEDVDADNPEVLAAARGEINLPVLNMKSFTYAQGRLNWGDPDNGSLSENGKYITVYRADHPIFKAMGKKKGDRIQVLEDIDKKGLMPIDVDYSGSLCLATALTRDIEEYYGDGDPKAFMHEVRADDRTFKKKYICMPISLSGSNHLSADGKRLITETINYLMGAVPSIYAPSLGISEFKIGSYETDYSKADSEGIIEIKVPVNDSDLVKTAEPQITLADPFTFYTAEKQYVNADGTVDFSNWHYGVKYVVSDYASKRYYSAIVRLYDPHQGIENIEVGTWVNIYDIYGRKVTTTNEDIRTMELPHGMYIVVTEDGQTIKIMK